jgi:hypothetical protein
MEGRILWSWTVARWMGSPRGARGGDHGRGRDEWGRIWEALLAWPGTEGGRGWGSPSWIELPSAPATSAEAMGARLHLGWSSPLPRPAAQKVRPCVSFVDRCPLASSSTTEDSATISSTGIERLTPRMQKPLRPPPAPRLTCSRLQPPPLRRARKKHGKAATRAHCAAIGEILGRAYLRDQRYWMRDAKRLGRRRGACWAARVAEGSAGMGSRDERGRDERGWGREVGRG